jgi:hypothetical protein
LFTYSSPGHDCHCYKLSPFQEHWGRWHSTSFLRPVCLFTVHMGSGSSPLSCGVSPTATFTSFPAPGCWACATAPAFSSQLVMRDFPSSPLWHSGHPALFAMCLFCCYCLLFRFFSFFPGWGLVCPGGYADLAQDCLWEYHVPLSSPCGLHFPKQSGCSCLAVAQECSWFLHLMWTGDALHRLEVWRSQCFASSQWFFL